MRWLVQENLNSTRNYMDIVDALVASDTYYLIVAFHDFTWKVVDKYTKQYLENSEEILDNFTKDKDVMVYGSKALAEFAEQQGYKPGSFHNENFDYSVLLEHFGNHMLNADVHIGTLFTLFPAWDRFFIRPSGNNKLFTGYVTTLEDFRKLEKEESAKEVSPYAGVDLVIAPYKQINTEYRFFIVDCRIVAHSSYAYAGTGCVDMYIPLSLIAFVRDMISIFRPAVAFVIDVAETNKGYKIVEFNNINTSGVYSCDIYAIVQAVNKLPEHLYR